MLTLTITYRKYTDACCCHTVDKHTYWLIDSSSAVKFYQCFPLWNSPGQIMDHDIYFLLVFRHGASNYLWLDRVFKRFLYHNFELNSMRISWISIRDGFWLWQSYEKFTHFSICHQQNGNIYLPLVSHNIFNWRSHAHPHGMIWFLQLSIKDLGRWLCCTNTVEKLKYHKLINQTIRADISLRFY